MTATILTFRRPETPSPGSDAAHVEVPTLPGPAPKRGKPTQPLTPNPLSRPPRALTEAEQRLQTRILDGFFCGRRAAQNHDPASIKRDRGHVEALLSFVGQPLWECTQGDFESWAGHLGLKRLLAAGSQRVMQTSVATFFDYATDNPGWQNEVRELCGGRIQQICTRENRLIHTCDDTPVRERRYLDAEELDQVFAMLEVLVEVAAVEAPRMLKTFQRDRAMFYVAYCFGLRLSELSQLNVTSFAPNPDIPELGRFGFVTVFGKGSRGSGKKIRSVPAVLPAVRPLMEWYLSEVRPQFRNGDGTHPALWLSEQGKRLCRASISARYKKLILACGLDPTHFSPHGLRHMFVSHQTMANVPLVFTQQSAGHVHGSTTTRYTHLKNDYMRMVCTNIVRQTMAEPPE